MGRFMGENACKCTDAEVHKSHTHVKLKEGSDGQGSVLSEGGL